MLRKTMTVAELIRVLSAAPQDAEVLCTWESINPEIAGVYLDQAGRVLIDSDGCFYMRASIDPAVPPYFLRDEDRDED